MTTQEHLFQHGVSCDTARDFIINNLNNLEIVYNTCLQFGVNNDMIAEILSSTYPDLTGEMVAGFFTLSGYNGNALGFNEEPSNNTLSDILSGQTVYFGIWGTPDTLESWTFNNDATYFLMEELYGSQDELWSETISFDIINNSEVMIDGSSPIKLLNSTDDYLEFENAQSGGYPLETMRIYFDKEKAEEYYDLSMQWLAGNTFYGVWWDGDTEQYADVVKMTISQDGTTITNEGMLETTNEDSYATNVEYINNYLTDGNILIPFEIKCATENYFAIESAGYDMNPSVMQLYFYDEQTALDYAATLTGHIQLECDIA